MKDKGAVLYEPIDEEREEEMFTNACVEENVDVEKGWGKVWEMGCASCMRGSLVASGRLLPGYTAVVLERMIVFVAALCASLILFLPPTILCIVGHYAFAWSWGDIIDGSIWLLFLWIVILVGGFISFIMLWISLSYCFTYTAKIVRESGVAVCEAAEEGRVGCDAGEQ